MTPADHLADLHRRSRTGEEPITLLVDEARAAGLRDPFLAIPDVGVRYRDVLDLAAGAIVRRTPPVVTPFPDDDDPSGDGWEAR